jgi:DNA-binding transcriptional LysR family regulator
MLDVQKLATLRAVVAHGSFSAAAQALHLTQPAVSRQISMLERQLGTLLVRRTQRGVHATEAGQALIVHVDAVLARLDQAESEIGDFNGLRRGTVRLGSFFSALVHLSAEVGAILGTAHPGIVVTDDLVDRAAALQGVRSGTIDVAFVFEHDFEPAPPTEGVELYPLFDDPLRVVLPARHRLADQPAVRIGELAAETWIRAHDGGAARRMDFVLARAGLSPPLLLAGRGEEPFEAQALVAAGKGVTLAHGLTVVVSHHELAIRPLDGEPGVRHVQAAVLPAPRPAAVDAAVVAMLELGATYRRRFMTTPESLT